MPDTKKKIYLGENLVCQTFTDAEEQAKAFDLFGLEQPIVSSNAPASTRPVQQGQVCEFDGVDDYMLSSELIRPNLDVEIIFKVHSSTGTNKAIFGGGGGSVRFYAQYNEYNGGTLHVVIGAYQSPGVLNSVTSVSEDVWHTLRMQSNGDWYLNGVFQANVGDAVTTTPANTSDNKLNIGRRGDSTGTHSNISVASFKVLDDGDLSTQYNLNHANGTTAFDSSGNGNDGTLQNGAAFVVDNTLPPEADKLNLEGFNKRMLFDGVNDDVTLPSDITGQITDVTGATWVGRIMTEDNSLSKQTVFSDFDGASGGNNKGFMIRLSGDDVLVNYLTSGGAWVGRQATAVVNSNTLTHITVTWSGGLTNGAFKIYVNGAQVDDADYSSGSIGAWQKSDSNYTIGARYSSGGVTNHFKGIISDPSFYYEELSSADVLDMYNGDAPDDTNLIAQYEGHGNTDADWVDLVGTNHGTVNGSPENLLIPRDESDQTNDIFGNPLQYSGSVYPRRPEYRNSYAASFDGVNDVIESNITSWTTSQASVACWIKTTNTGNESIATQWASSSGWWVRIKAGKIEIYTSAGLRFASADSYNTGEWIHVAISYGLSTANNKLWINGVLEEEMGTSAGWSTATTPVLVGGLSASGYNYDGKISNIIIDNQIWSDDDALALYNGTYTGALIHHPLTEGAGDTAYDISGNGNHGTINNASTGTEGAGFWAGRIDGEANALNNNNGFSKRMLFDGVNDYVSFNLGSFNTSAWSVKATFQFNSLSATQDIFSQAAGTGTGRAWVRIGTGGAAQTFLGGLGSTTIAPAGTFVEGGVYEIELVYTLSPNTLTLIVNGVSQSPVLRTVEESTGLFHIGVGHIASGGWFSGTSYNATLNGRTYAGDGNTNANWEDTSGNGNNGTVNGSPALLRIPADTSDPTKDVLGYTLTNPAITDGYNGAETELDAYNIAEGENPSPATNNNPDLDAIEFGTDFAANDAAFMRLKSSTENDRLITFEDDLTGGDETLAQKYTQ